MSSSPPGDRAGGAVLAHRSLRCWGRLFGGAQGAPHACRAFCYRHTDTPQDLGGGDFGVGGVPPSRPGGAGGGVPLIPSDLDEGPTQGLIFGGPKIPHLASSSPSI